jgi:hypothetical protein
LIVLGIVNGGLGIRLASFSPFQTDETTRKAKIAYGVVAAAVFVLYLVLVIVFEVRRIKVRRSIPSQEHPQIAHARHEAKLPTYDESQSEESLQSNGRTRYR